MIADGGFIGPWAQGAERTSKIVFIGRNLNRPQLRRGFEACQAGVQQDMASHSGASHTGASQVGAATA